MWSAGDLFQTNPEAIECALAALRDRTPGLLSWYHSEEGGFAEIDGYVLITTDGRAIRREWGRVDLSHFVGDADLGPLHPPWYFEYCLTNYAPAEAFNCVVQPLEGLDEVCGRPDEVD